MCSSPSGRSRHFLPILLAILFLATPADSQVVPTHNDPLTAKVLAPGGFVATPVPEDVAEVSVDAATRAEIDAFRGAAGGSWSFYVDRRSGGMALVKGAGIRWVSGEASIDELAQKAVALMTEYPALFQVPVSELVLDRRGSLIFGERNQFAAVVFNQVIDGVPVDASRVGFYVSHGNLVMFGVDRIASASMNIRATRPAITADEARLAFVAYIGGLQTGDVFYEDANLLWVLRGTGDTVASGPIGSNWDAHLVYRFVFGRGALSNWEVLVSASTGTILRFVDANKYASVVAKASVLTVSNCTDPLNCSIAPTAPVFAGNQPEVTVTMPYLKLNFAGALCTGDACYTNGGGAFNYPPGAAGVGATLEGKYFRIVDTCGATATAGVAPGGFDFGTSNPLAFPGNVDCAPGNRQSAPDSAPNSAGPGNTHSARSTYYHLNLIAAKSRFFLPTNEWLKGAGGTRGAVNVTTNLPPACNAFWLGLGNQGTLNFMRFTPGLNCNNTGELVGVFLHEYGHGLDQNDGSGTAPEGGTGEAMGDTFALLEGQQPCIGSGFILLDPTVTNPWFNKAGYGSNTAGSHSRHCSGVRTLDYRELCSHDATVNCVNRDPDSPNGSRSGVSPTSTTDTGTPARYNNMINGAGNAADGRSQFYSCGAPGASCAGPLTLECHCESQIASQANWDLAKLFIENVFGGNIYRSPQGPTEVAGWQYMDRLWYLTRDTAASAYTASGPSPAGVTSGCAASTWFQQYLLVDDDNGNLADGTPHADLIFSAFDRHAITCGAPNAPANMSSGRSTPPPAPVLSACSTTAPLQITWNAVPGATKYRVLRNTLGCGFGFTPLKTVSGSNLYYEDSEVAAGVPYYYAVQPIGEDDSAYGFVSSCVTITPANCTPVSVPAPTGVTATASGDNQMTVAWAASSGATLYKVLRKDGNCAAAGAYSAVGVTSGTSFVDNDNLVGSKSYSYQVVATNASCASCTSAPSNCASAVATGACKLPPSFAGVTSVVSSAAGGCKLTVRWSPATSNCGSTTFTYSVYRDTSASFLPSPANLVAAGLSGIEYADTNVTGGTRYFYIVRATDGFGNADGNVVRKSDIASGKATNTAFSDNVEGTRRFLSVPLVGGADWVVKTDGTLNATKTYATQAGAFYATGKCQSLESESFFLGASPTLSFTTRFGMQSGLVGGIVQVATEASGFTSWRKLNTVNYPGVMAGTLILGCNDPGFANGERAFSVAPPVNSSANWISISASLSEYANQRVRVRFLFSSENGAGLVFNGWLLDNIAVSDSKVAGSCGVNTPPQAQNDSAVTTANASITINVLNNDLDADGDALSVTAVTQGATGSVLNNRNGTVTYTPVAGSSGADSFTYTISDNQGGSTSGTVTVNVTNDALPSVLFGHDTISDFSATSGEPFIRVAPANTPFRDNIYVTVPFGLSTTISLLWRSIDGGKSFIPLGSPITRDAVTGPGGGDTHLDFDAKGRLYYADLSGGCVMTAVSEDGGNTFPPDRTNHLTCIGGGDDPQGAQDDRQWVGAFGDGLGYATVRNLALSVGGNFHLFRTRDAGRTWRGQVIGSVTQSAPLQVDKTKRKVVVNGVEKDAILLYQPYYLGTSLRIFRIIDLDDGSPALVDNPPGFTPGGSVSTVFPNLTLDNAGHLYYAWSNGTNVFMATSVDRGNTWSPPVQVSPPSLAGANIMPWIVAGDPGRVNVVWYRTAGANNATGVWDIYMAQTLNAIGATPSFTVTKVSETVIHRGEICTRGLNCDLPVIPIVNPLGPGDRSFLEFPSIDIDSQGAAAITFNDNTNQADGEGRPGGAYVMVTRQTGGPSLYSSIGSIALDPGSVTITQPVEGQQLTEATVPVAGTHTLPADNVNVDEIGDAKFPDHGLVIGASIPALDLRNVTVTDDASSITVTMQLGDLTLPALATAAAQSGGDGVLFLTQWDFNDKVYWVAAEVRGGAPLFYTGSLGIIKSATSKKFITYNPDLVQSQQLTGSISNTAPGAITIRIPRSLAGTPANGASLFTLTAYTMSERGPLIPVGDLGGNPNPNSLPIQVDATAPFNYAVSNGSPVDGVVEVSLDSSSFANPTLATAGGDGTWSATLSGVAPGAHTVYARQRINGRAASPAALVNFTILEPNRAPVAAGDAYSTAEDSMLSVGAPGVLANDHDPDGDAMSAVLVSGPSNGTLTLQPDGSFTYTPAANYNGGDSFTYRTTDGALDSNVATVAITVTAVNDPPLANDDAYSTKPNAALSVSAPGVLANDSDIDSSTLHAILVSSVANGTLTLNADGSFVYTPSNGFKGTDSFTYKANDGAADSNIATVTLAVTSDAGRALSLTGSGEVTVQSPDGVASFGFNVKRKTVDGAPSGQLNYFNHARNLSVESVSITTLNIAGTKGSFGGTCTKNGAPCTFTVTVEDNGEPGKGLDRFTIAVSDEPVEGGAAPIVKGNIQVK